MLGLYSKHLFYIPPLSVVWRCISRNQRSSLLLHYINQTYHEMEYLRCKYTIKVRVTSDKITLPQSISTEINHKGVTKHLLWFSFTETQYYHIATINNKHRMLPHFTSIYDVTHTHSKTVRCVTKQSSNIWNNSLQHNICDKLTCHVSV